MSWRIWSCLALGVGLLSSGGAAAQERVIREKDRVIYRKRSVVDFNDMVLEGELTRPEGSYIINRERAEFPSRIKIRSSFAPEMQKSVDHL